MVAAMRRKFGRMDGNFGSLTEKGSYPLAGFDGGTGKEAVVTHSRKAFGQDVKKPAADEFGDGEF